MARKREIRFKNKLRERNKKKEKALKDLPKPLGKGKLYCMIPNQTIIDMMGLPRWERIIEAIRKTYNTCRVRMEYTKPPTMRIMQTDGKDKMIGTLKEVEAWAKKVV